MKILIYGAGAVGLGLASCLLKSGQRIDLIGREETVLALKRHGLIRTGIFGDFHASPQTFDCYSSLTNISSKCYNFILVSTKSFDTEEAASDLNTHALLWNQNTKFILFQNGWGNTEKFTVLFPQEQIFNARVITGFTRPQPHHAEITVHADKVLIGSLVQASLKDIEGLCESITRGDLPCGLSQNIAKDLWAKMLYNCSLNALGAILNVPYGTLGELDSSRSIMRNIFEEVYAVMAAAGYQTHWPTASTYATIFYEKLLPPTAEHHSSTLQDLKSGKKTEIDAFNGVICQMGENFHINVPVNHTLYQIVKFIECNRLHKIAS